MDKQKIGIITILKCYNYGAELQAMALANFLQEQGYNVQIIDYLFYKNLRHIYSDTDYSIEGFDRVKRLKNILKFRLANAILEYVIPIFSRNQRNRHKRFQRFHQDYTPMSKEYRSMDELYCEELGYDTYIVGSDCVWCYYTEASIEPYFLTFAPQNKNRISYASSFGVSAIPEQLKPKYKELLNNIKTISVREGQGINLVREITGREAKLVLDPTLLMDKVSWRPFLNYNLCIPVQQYVLVYQLYPSQQLISIAQKMANALRIPVWCLCKRAIKNPSYNGVKNIQDAGPSEFMSYIKNAKCVVTDSFHGTAFSVNFNVDFYTVLSNQRKDNSRMESFLDMLNLQSRIVWLENNSNINYTPIDFTHANKILEEERVKSVEYLINAIEG